MSHFGIRGASNGWFKSYLSNRNQYLSIKGYESGFAALNCDVTQESVIGTLLFLLYIRYIYSIYTTFYSIEKLNKLVNADLKHLFNWLNTNKISLSVKKTEILIFKSKRKKFESDLKIKLGGKRLYPTERAKYLGVKFSANLSWQYHVNNLFIKLNRVNALENIC